MSDNPESRLHENNAVEAIANKFCDQIADAQLGAEGEARLFNKLVEQLLVPNHASLFWGDRLMTLDKSMGFFQNPRFKQAFETILGAHQYDQYGGRQTIAWRLHTLVWGAENGVSLPGEFVECGTFQGDMAWVITQVIDLVKSNKTFYLYDTFEGFSKKYSSNNDFPDNPGFLDFANSVYGKPGIYEEVCQRFEDNKRVKILKGVVPDVLHEEAPETIAFLHIDLNSPAAEVGALELLFDRVSPGGVIIFDDYGWKVFRPQKEAEDKFMSERGYSIMELPTGQGLVVKR